MENNRRSPLFYVGDKYKLLNQIIPFFPKDIVNYYEPFVGGGSVFLNVIAKRYYLNDIDSNLIQIHKCLQNFSSKKELLFANFDSIIKAYSLSESYKEDHIPLSLKQNYKKTYFAKFNKEGYGQLKKDFNNSKAKDPLKLYILLIYGFNRMLRFNREGKFNLPVGNVDFNNNTAKAISDYIDFIYKKNITLYNLDFEAFLALHKVEEKDFVYFDPPYLITSSEYNKIWNSTSEERLLKTLDTINANGSRFALSNVIQYQEKNNTLLENWAKKYNVHTLESNYINYHNNKKKKILEVLITNYE